MFKLDFRQLWFSVCVLTKNWFEITKSLLFHLSEDKISTIYMGEISHSSANPFELLTFMLLQYVIFCSNNHYRNLHCRHSSCIFMSLPLFIYSSFNVRSKLWIWSLQLGVNMCLDFSNSVCPILKMMQGWTWLRHINRYYEDCSVKPLFVKWNLNQVYKISATA